jgi:hypothetical protein
MKKSRIAAQALSILMLCATLVGCASLPEYATALSTQAAWTGAADGAARSGPDQFDALLKLAGGSFVSSDSRLDLLSEDDGTTLVLIHSRADLPRSGMPWKLRKGPPNGHLALSAHGLHWAASHYHARILPSGDLLLGWITEDGEVRGFTYRVQTDGSVIQRMVSKIDHDGTFTESSSYASNYRPERAGMAEQAAARMRANERADAQRQRAERAESEATSAALYGSLQRQLATTTARETSSRPSAAAQNSRPSQATSAPVTQVNRASPASTRATTSPQGAAAFAPQGTVAGSRAAVTVNAPIAHKLPPPTSSSTLDDPSGCVSAPAQMKHPNCKDGTAFGVRNSCVQAVDVRMCIKTTAGRWDCGASPTLNPGASWSYPSCAGTSTVWMDTRSAGTRARRFNDPR